MALLSRGVQPSAAARSLVRRRGSSLRSTALRAATAIAAVPLTSVAGRTEAHLGTAPTAGK